MDFASLEAEYFLIVAAVPVLIRTVLGLFPALATKKATARLLPVVPLLLCSAAVWIPGIADDMEIGNRIFLGIALGSIAGQSHKLAKQTVMGDDRRIRRKHVEGD